MALSELLKLVPAPERPVEAGDSSQWREVERSLGTSLPPDYKEFVHTYGTGNLGQFVRVLNPFARSEFSALVPSATRITQVFREMSDFTDGRFKYALHPDKPGLLPWGTDDNGNFYFWLTVGSAVEWKVVICEGRGPLIQEVALSMTSFLARALSGKLKVKVWPKGFPDKNDASRFQFEPFGA